MSSGHAHDQAHDHAHDHGGDPDDPDAALHSDDCETVLAKVYEFLDHEIEHADGDRIRAHLAACEPCLETFDAEQALKSLVARCCGGDVAPDHLRLKVMAKITRTQVTLRES
ncbi:mycothiol system anti-sigma-R factor [Friedmanniella endophytica]|uniref:Mycothiol system anti-sigma-R factor n=1 Tax=Microlunatus kandeliicorticis TaxID=1759536 RepID=A0A7W3IUR6_9ACTN|nr:mycothiol system anti-sigma-R factor [Microlunatus kandeliicorticis]MBA8795592.1 mycothiol system anti-sigma-R factor [Microlunatus kandeliicorticis]